jgi:putative oxidoreductase
MWLLKRFMHTRAPAAVILIRLLVGGVFLSEGIQKFVYPEQLGVGRFVKIGIPHPQIMAPVVGCFEIGCGTLLILGLFTRLAAIPLIAIISVAIWTTKIPMLAEKGFWSMAHEARTDYCMLLGGLCLLIVGAGALSFDRWLSVKSPPSTPERTQG